MSTTSFASGNALTVKHWMAKSEQLFRDAAKESYFLPRFGSAGKNSIVYEKKELMSKKGDKITFGIRMRLSGNGVGPGQTLEGNEESLTTHDYSVTMTRRRHAVRVENGLSEQRIQMDQLEEARLALVDWMAEYIDETLFTALRGTPTTVWYNNNGTPTKATAAAAKAAITAAEDKLTPKLISALRAWAVTGGNRSQTPLRPIMVDGRKTFVLLIHPDVAFDLKNDSTYAQAKREADDRGKKNPLFTGALGVWDNVVIHEHENVYIATDAGGSADQPYAECFLLGAQSLCWAWGKRERMVEEDFDYEEETGIATRLNYAVGKPQFNSKDYGSIGVFVGRTQISDAS